MLVADISKPVDFVCVFEQAKCDRMDGCVAPSLIEEASRSIEMIEVVFVHLGAPEVHIPDLEIRPEVACRVAICLLEILAALLVVLQPFDRAVRVRNVIVIGDELLCLGPETCDALGVVVQIDREAVSLVVVFHPPEDVVINVAEKVDVRLNSPVPPDILQCWVLVEHAAVPSAHLVVGSPAHVLHALLFEDLDGLLVQVFIDPAWGFPMLFRNLLEGDLRVRCLSNGLHELFLERLVVEKEPRVVELVIEGPFEVSHGHEHVLKLTISYKGEEGRVCSIRVWIIRRVVVAIHSPQWFRGFAGSYLCQPTVFLRRGPMHTV